MNKPLSGKCVLIVEDEPLIAIMLEDMVDELGCMSRYTVANRDNALQAVGSQHLDLAILDVNLTPTEVILQWPTLCRNVGFPSSSPAAIPPPIYR